jgi:hypothetical protein
MNCCIGQLIYPRFKIPNLSRRGWATFSMVVDGLVVKIFMQQSCHNGYRCLLLRNRVNTRTHRRRLIQMIHRSR